jgi:H+/Cl- antiporter ClcA
LILCFHHRYLLITVYIKEMEVGSSTDFALLSDSLLEPSTPAQSQADVGKSSDSNPTPLRYFFSDSKNNNDGNEPAAQVSLEEEMEHESVETVDREKEVQLVALRVLGKPVPRTFWFRDWPMAALLGALLGILALGFLTAVHGTLNLWFKPPNNGDAPKFWWLAVTTLGGFICSVLLLFPKAPSVGTFRTMYHDAMDLKGYPAQALFSVFACFVCLATGAPLGPEMALGAIASGLASFVAEKLNVNRRTEAAWVFSSMAGSLGGLFPSPILGVTLVHELSVAGRPNGMTLDAIVSKENMESETRVVDHDFMEQVTLAGTAAITAHLVLHSLLPKNIPFGNVIEIGNDYHTWHLAAAIPLGIVCGLVASLALILLGVFRTIRAKVCQVLEEKLGAPKWIGRVLFPTLAGTLHGLLAISNPYLVGSGIPFVAHLIQNRESIKVGSLVLMALCKAVSMSLSLGFGLVGGPLFPMVFVGLCVGLAFSSIFPVSLAVPCCACATVIFVPIPFTLVLYVAMALSLTVPQITPIFIATFVSYTVVGGLGIVRRLGEHRLGVSHPEFDGDDLISFEENARSDQSVLRGIRQAIFGGNGDEE